MGSSLEMSSEKIDYLDVENYSAIEGELSWHRVKVEQIINIETKKNFFRIWYKKLQE